MINLSKIAPNDVVSLSGWCAYWMLGTAETHVSVYTKKLETKQWQVIRSNQVKRGQKTRVADVPPPDLFFDEFHVTLKGCTTSTPSPASSCRGTVRRTPGRTPSPGARPTRWPRSS
jgi:hypothetical protein